MGFCFRRTFMSIDPLSPTYRNKHIMIDLGTGNNNKINWAMEDKQEMIDIIETVYRGARKGRGLVVSPKDYSTKYRYWALAQPWCTRCRGVVLTWRYFQLFKAFEKAFGEVHVAQGAGGFCSEGGIAPTFGLPGPCIFVSANICKYLAEINKIHGDGNSQNHLFLMKMSVQISDFGSQELTLHWWVKFRCGSHGAAVFCTLVSESLSEFPGSPVIRALRLVTWPSSGGWSQTHVSAGLVLRGLTGSLCLAPCWPCWLLASSVSLGWWCFAPVPAFVFTWCSPRVRVCVQASPLGGGHPAPAWPHLD